MQRNPVGGERHRPCPDGLFGESRHLVDLFLGSGPVHIARAPEHIGADRSVRHLGGQLDGPGPALQGIEVFGKTLPSPVDAVGEGRARNILHPLHESDQEILGARANRGKAHPAIADHRGGDAMVRRRRQAIVPSSLAVVVGVGVHEARRHRKALRFDHLAGAGGIHRCGRLDAPHQTILHHHVCGALRAPRAINQLALPNQ